MLWIYYKLELIASSLGLIYIAWVISDISIEFLQVHFIVKCNNIVKT